MVAGTLAVDWGHTQRVLPWAGRDGELDIVIQR